MKTKTIIKNNEVQLLAKGKQQDHWIHLENWKISNQLIKTMFECKKQVIKIFFCKTFT